MIFVYILQYFRMQSDAVVFEGSLGAVQHNHACSTRHYHSVHLLIPNGEKKHFLNLFKVQIPK